MASNSFGHLFKMTTWGESHGKAMGVVIDGCPSGIFLTEQDINQELYWRKPGRNELTSPRREEDQVEILSGLFNGQTTGAPISLIIWNKDVNSGAYEGMHTLFRPGHANYTYSNKYGIFDYRGGGRASARETVCRVAAGAIAKKILSDVGISVVAYLYSIGEIEGKIELSDHMNNLPLLQQIIRDSSLFSPSPAAEKMKGVLEEARKEGDSVGGIVEAMAFNVPCGWGDPVYEKLEANLAKAMLSIPASKGFEIGEGFKASQMRGSEHNDLFGIQNDQISFVTNHAGGTLGGISTGEPIIIKVPFKPTSSINKVQTSLNEKGEICDYRLPTGSRHDPCVAIRAVPVVEAMMALVLVDAFLMSKFCQLN
ncbi:chorismate synthase [Candidatus Protochlamydia sp. R18]|uniref:chorismate synthase n=1 Tax=Candidatus Protochlamydia sp. R18 TaxID=1353977 RepID=UPI0005A9C269|nr:chorismate synthase [Candidatus Protochlamydia sp. R18]